MTKQIPAIVEKFLNDVTRKHAPDASVKFKSESWLNRAIAFIVKPFNPTFLNNYITTIGTTIWVPDDFFDNYDDINVLEVIAHETQHIIDLKKLGAVPFVVAYGFPQILALLSILALGAFFGGPAWLLWLLCLGFAAPIPAYGRYRFELNGYRTSYVVGRLVHHYGGSELAQVDGWVIEQLSNKWYFYTWPFPKMIKADLQDNAFLSLPRYVELADWLKANGFVTPADPKAARKKITFRHQH
jgi:hypothetical protein